MFKKINFDKTRPNFLREVKREFGSYFLRFNLKLKVFCEDYPKQIFTGMVVSILASVILSFTVIVPMEKQRLAAEVLASQQKIKEKNLNAVRNQPSSNISNMINGISKVGTTLHIKHRIDAILLKTHLTREDSANLSRMLDSIKLNTARLTK